MSTDFNWQTEDEKWGEEPILTDERERPKRRWWPRALIALLIVIGLGVLAYRQVRQQLDAAVARTEADVRRTHELVLQAADRNDRDLLTSMVSGRDQAWLNDLLELTEEGLLYNPTPLGFHVQNGGAGQYEFELSADLTEAEVETTRQFTVQSLRGVSETVLLKQSAIYRQGQDRWLYSPPQEPEAYWQGSVTDEGRFLTITYPMRDAEAVEPLFEYLDEKLVQMCTELEDFRCPDNFRVEVELSTDLQVQIPLLDNRNLFIDQPTLILPTLTLVGLPVDEAGRDAIYRGYAEHVIRAGMIRALEWECCERGIYFRALLDYQLEELGVRPYPMTPADYERLFSRFQQIDQLDIFWPFQQIELTNISDWQWVYALTEFALTTSMSTMSAGAMQQSLGTAEFYTTWIDEILTEEVADASLQQAWLNFIYGRSLSGQVAEGTFAPRQDILLQCENISQPRSVLYRYNWSNDSWQEIDRFDEPTLFIDTMPDDSGLVVQQGSFEGVTSTFVWRNGERVRVFDGSPEEVNGYYFFGHMSPNGNQLFMTKLGVSVGNSVLDLEDCGENGCNIEPVPGRPVWSPNGSQVLYELLEPQEEFQAIVGVGRINSDGELIVLTNIGFSPFWLSEEEYGFVTFGEAAGVYSALTADDQPKLLLTQDDLLQTLPEEGRPDSLDIHRVAPNPANRNLLSIDGYFVGKNQNESYQFLWNRLTGETKLLGVLRRVIVGPGGWHSNGEWMVLPAFETENLSPENSSVPYSYYVFHVSGERKPIILRQDDELSSPPLDQTIDGDWLVIAKSNYLELVALKHLVGDNVPYRRLLAHDFNRCRNALFVW